MSFSNLTRMVGYKHSSSINGTKPHSRRSVSNADTILIYFEIFARVSYWYMHIWNLFYLWLIRFQRLADDIVLILPWYQVAWGQHGAHLGSTGPKWAPCGLHENCNPIMGSRRDPIQYLVACLTHGVTPHYRQASDILVNIGSGNCLVLIRHQAISSINVDLLTIEIMEANYSEIWIKMI